MSRQSDSLRSLAAMSWQRPNIGSRMNREVHVRFWERAEVKFLRATRLDVQIFSLWGGIVRVLACSLRSQTAAAAPSDKEHIANEAINALAKAVTDQGLSAQ